MITKFQYAKKGRVNLLLTPETNDERVFLEIFNNMGRVTISGCWVTAHNGPMELESVSLHPLPEEINDPIQTSD